VEAVLITDSLRRMNWRLLSKRLRDRLKNLDLDWRIRLRQHRLREK
jgi:hypothetical protein